MQDMARFGPTHPSVAVRRSAPVMVIRHTVVFILFVIYVLFSFAFLSGNCVRASALKTFRVFRVFRGLKNLAPAKCAVWQLSVRQHPAPCALIIPPKLPRRRLRRLALRVSVVLAEALRSVHSNARPLRGSAFRYCAYGSF